MLDTDTVVPEQAHNGVSRLMRSVIWIAIGALIAAALVCVVWILIGDENGLIARAFLTIVLLVAFAGIAVMEVSLAPKRSEWLSLASMVAWVVVLIAGAIKIWLPEEYALVGDGMLRFFYLLLIIGITQLVLVHLRVFIPASRRYITAFTRTITIATVVFVVALAGMLVVYLALPDTWDYPALYWRIVVSLAIVAAVGSTLIPLLNALFAPKKTRPAPLLPWPTYADGFTPLPALTDGTPDWNAYSAAVVAVSAPVGYPAIYSPQTQLAPGQQVAQQLPPLPPVAPAPPAVSVQAAPPAPPASSVPLASSAEPVSSSTAAQPPSGAERASSPQNYEPDYPII